MVDKSSAPAFSMGSGNRSGFKNEWQPGPGAYDSVSFLNTHKTHKVSNAKRFSEYTTYVPGPGAYQSRLKEHTPSASIVAKTKDRKPDQVPGPGSYSGDYKKVLKSNSSYKIGSSDRVTDDSRFKKDLPGPGQYQSLTSSFSKHETSNKFGQQKRLTLQIDKNMPGPGQYEQSAYYNGSMLTNPKVSFTKSSRSQSLSTIGPGPGSYAIKDDLTDSLIKKKGFTIKFRTNEHSQDPRSSPGPGAYNSEYLPSNKKGAPAFSISKQPKLKLEGERQMLSKPNPYTYNTNLSSFNKTGSKIGNQKRRGLENVTYAPGPGAYEPKQVKVDLHYSIPKSNSTSKLNSQQAPGPGSYQPNSSATFNSQYNAIAISKDKRRPFYDEKLGLPGPGQYVYNQSTIQKNGYSIGNQKRGANKSPQQPGPGNYKLPSTISNLPGYATSKHK